MGDDSVTLRKNQPFLATEAWESDLSCFARVEKFRRGAGAKRWYLPRCDRKRYQRKVEGELECLRLLKKTHFRAFPRPTPTWETHRSLSIFQHEGPLTSTYSVAWHIKATEPASKMAITKTDDQTPRKGTVLRRKGTRNERSRNETVGNERPLVAAPRFFPR